jgi:hypothetical protein
MEIATKAAPTLDQLRSMPDSWDRVLFFMSDLLRASDDEEILAHLQPHDEFYLPLNYFTEEERMWLLELPVSIDDVNQTLRAAISALLEKKTNALGKTHICSSHDLFPLFRTAFHLQKGFHANKALKQRHNKFWNFFHKSHQASQ